MEAVHAHAPRRTSTSSVSSRAARAASASSPPSSSSASSSPVLSKATLGRSNSHHSQQGPDLSSAASTSAINSLLSATTTTTTTTTTTSSPDLRSLVAAAQDAIEQTREEQRDVFLSHAPTLLSLHAELQHSIGALDSLSLFLTTFSNDLASVSHQISTLKEKSRSIEDHLAAKRALEEPLGALLAKGIVLDPRVVQTIFDTDPDRTWAGVIHQLENTLEATRRPLDQLAGVPATTTTTTTTGQHPHRRNTSQQQQQQQQQQNSQHTQPPPPPDQDPAFKALTEARQVAEACKVMASAKIRSYLVHPFALLRASVSTNLQILQTSILLPHHQPLYAFLARQSPRLAIDVQRAYVAAARLYFETGFRRYARSLAAVKKRGYKQKTEGVGGIADLGGGGALAALLGGGGGPNTPSSSSRNDDDRHASDDADRWRTDPARLVHAHVDGPGVTLGYQSDDAAYRAPPEALFRSLSLVYFDNACSEYAFIVRYFEGLALRRGGRQTQSRRSRASRANDDVASASTSLLFSPTSSVPATPVTELSEEHDLAPVAPVAPEDSASVVAGGDGDGDGDGDDDAGEAGDRGDLVQLSRSEQASLKGRGAADELFKKVFEPATGTWLGFSRSLLSSSNPYSSSSSATTSSAGVSSSSSGGSHGPAPPLINPAAALAANRDPPPLLPLLCMIQLTDELLALADVRGASAVLTGPLLQFKMEAWPLLQKRLQEDIDALSKLAGLNSAGGASGSSSSSSSAGGLGGWMRSAAAAVGAGGGGSSAAAGADAERPLSVDEAAIQRIALRYATLYAHVTQVCVCVSVSVSVSVGGGRGGASTASEAGPEAESPSALMLFSSLLRLRNALEKLIERKAAEIARRSGASGTSGGSAWKTDVASRVWDRLALASSSSGVAGAGAGAGVRMQREMSHWGEVRRGAGAVRT